jgi:methylene-fatty-acyl-phospholipid synthase
MTLSDYFVPLLLAGFLLSIERISYVLIWNRPQLFADLTARTRIADNPVSALERLFYVFKLIQLLVFGCWIVTFSDPAVSFSGGTALSQGIAVGLLLVGQFLNLSTFWQLGREGVFYGARFGHNIPWRFGFPFSVFPHPQYLGTVMSIWGIFLLFRYPGLDWYLIPALETVLYILGACFEHSNPRESAALGDDSRSLAEKAIESL